MSKTNNAACIFGGDLDIQLLMTGYSDTDQEIRAVRIVRDDSKYQTTSAFAYRESEEKQIVLQSADAIPEDRCSKLNRYKLITGFVSLMWMLAALASLFLHIHSEPFFALFFSTFSLYVVFAIKYREANG
jgi:hypothetical protein